MNEPNRTVDDALALHRPQRSGSVVFAGLVAPGKRSFPSSHLRIRSVRRWLQAHLVWAPPRIILAALALLISAAIWAKSTPAFDLVDFALVDRLTAEGYRDRRSASAPDPDGPLIELIQPTTLNALADVPFDIELSITPRGSSGIRFESLQIFYRAQLFDLDVTQRWLPNTSLKNNRLHISDGKLRAGRHGFSVLIEDLDGRQGMKDFIVSVHFHVEF